MLACSICLPLNVASCTDIVLNMFIGDPPASVCALYTSVSLCFSGEFYASVWDFFRDLIVRLAARTLLRDDGPTQKNSDTHPCLVWDSNPWCHCSSNEGWHRQTACLDRLAVVIDLLFLLQTKIQAEYLIKVEPFLSFELANECEITKNSK